jgi:putative ABC transport system permease protein
MTDLRDALRALRGTPVVTSVAILSLGLGIGANVAMFSIVDALVLRPLPVREADRLTLLSSTVKSATSDETWANTSWTNPIWEAIRDRPTLFGGAFAYGDMRFDMSQRGEVDPIDGLRASGRMFEVLGVNAVLGRTFDQADDRPGGGPDGAVVVLSYGFWQSRFGGARDIIGRTITLNRVPFTVVGVTGPSFFGPDVGRTFDVAVPIGTMPLVSGFSTILQSRDSWWLHVMARLAPGQSLEQATAAIRAVQPQIADETRPATRGLDPSPHLARPFELRLAATGSSDLRKNYQRPVFALMGIVALTLLIACGNIANLLLARGVARRHELSVRTALGASSWRLGRQLFTESALLAGAGALAGVAFARWGSRVIVAQLSTATDRVFLDVGIDWRVLAFAAAVAAATAILFGVVPALRAARVAPIDAMKEHGRGTSSGRAVGLSGSLVIAQVSLSLVLLVGTGLFLRTFASLANRNVGFERDRALILTVGAQRAGVDSAARAAMYERIRQAALAVPGVSNAAFAMTLPLGDNTLVRRMEFPGRPPLPEQERIVRRNAVSPGFFATLGTPLLLGRDFDQRDRPGSVRTVIVNQAFVNKYFAGENPIGRVIAETPDPNADPAPLEIIGVVGDAIYRSAREAVLPTMYWSLNRLVRPPSSLKLVVRAATASPTSLARSVSAAVMGVNPDLTLSVRSLADQVNAAITQERLVATLSGFFGLLALIIAALGLYGITAYAVTQRHVELGIRMALGTTPAGVVRLVLSRLALLVGSGMAIGGVVSVWATTFIASLLFDVAPRDPTTIGLAAAVLGATGALAGWLPAWRAARIDPAKVLRDG